MPEITLRNVARVLMQDDGAASRADAKRLEAFVEGGTASRAELGDVLRMIDSSDLSFRKKKSCLRELTAYMAKTSSGIETHLFGVDVAKAGRLASRGIETPADLLDKAATPAQRAALCSSTRMAEKDLRQLVKQADLQRVDGVDPKVAKVLLDAGIDSVPELAQRNPESLRELLKEYASSRESWVIKFKLPSQAEVDRWCAQAKELPRVVEFGRPDQGFEALPVEDRARMLMHGDASLNAVDVRVNTAAEFFDGAGLGDKKAAFIEEQLWVLEEIAGRLNYIEEDWDGNPVDINVTGRDLLEGRGPDGDEVGYSYPVEPEISAYRDSGGKLLGASFRWVTDDGAESETWAVVYDAIEGEFTAQDYWNSY